MITFFRWLWHAATHWGVHDLWGKYDEYEECLGMKCSCGKLFWGER